ncbi:MAG: hypothetical protein JJ892_12550 [Balneola sp.]|nr:hypothetical protein [Balneola sp.]MBO6651072.1 hypothetical protein [Balneola sp.]MBO6712800.1 hypothetical protein [Balneola sp.]MBO6801099.1 hypothetical protein [Balneola sp.]MBO6871291.1 hypothetical protein [Balneola sp.]
MKLLIKHLSLLFCFLMLSLNCKSSDSITTDYSPNEGSNVQTDSEAVSDTTRIIEVLINDRVKYEFIRLDTTWSGMAFQYDTNDLQTQKVVREIPLVPEYGWSDFESMVDFLNIYTMPDQTEILDRKPGPLTPQSRAYKFIVFDGDTTRSYFYFNPEGEVSQYWQSQNVVTFGTYILNEMKVLEN